MTVDDLIGVYIEASNAVVWEAEKRDLCPMSRDIQRAGVTAIVRALRDEFGRRMEPSDDWNRMGIVDVFNEILGSDAAPAPQANTVELSTAYVSQIEQSRTEAHRNAAPAVCEWTGEEYVTYSTSCESEHEVDPHKAPPKHCPSCGLPIKFTEAK